MNKSGGNLRANFFSLFILPEHMLLVDVVTLPDFRSLQILSPENETLCQLRQGLKCPVRVQIVGVEPTYTDRYGMELFYLKFNNP